MRAYAHTHTHAHTHTMHRQPIHTRERMRMVIQHMVCINARSMYMKGCVCVCLKYTPSRRGDTWTVKQKRLGRGMDSRTIAHCYSSRTPPETPESSFLKTGGKLRNARSVLVCERVSVRVVLEGRGPTQGEGSLTRQIDYSVGTFVF